MGSKNSKGEDMVLTLTTRSRNYHVNVCSSDTVKTLLKTSLNTLGHDLSLLSDVYLVFAENEIRDTKQRLYNIGMCDQAEYHLGIRTKRTPLKISLKIIQSREA